MICDFAIISPQKGRSLSTVTCQHVSGRSFSDFNCIQRNLIFSWASVLFLITRLFQNAILAVNKFEITTNEEVVSGGLATIKNISTGLLISIQGTVMRDIEKLVAYGRFNVPENHYDHKYSKELLRTVVDVEKVLKGVTTNFLAKSVLDVLKESLDFQFSFPIKKVVAPI